MPKKNYGAQYQRNRATLLEGKPLCHWCQNAPATQADHVIPVHEGGTDNLDNLVPACATCNHRRGQQTKTKSQHARLKARTAAVNANGQDIRFLDSTSMTPSKLSFSYPRTGTDDSHRESPRFGRELPRLETPRLGYGSIAGMVAAWSQDHLKVDLLGWQVHALEGALEVDEDGDLYNRMAYVSVARQNGKTVLGQALAGWWVTKMAEWRQKPQTVIITAHELSLAAQQFERLGPILEEHFGFTLKRAYGRQVAIGPDGSHLWIKAATPTASHGMSADLVWADEIWSISDEVMAHGLRPTMKARNKFTAGGNPLMFMTSTAGTEASEAQIRYREQGLKIIDDGKPARFYMAEWSPPGNVDPMDEQWWPWANPSLGVLINLDDLRVDANHPDRVSFLRASLNLFVAADEPWLQPGRWENLVDTATEFPSGGFLACDSSIDDSRYVGVVGAPDDKGNIHLRVAFVVTTLTQFQAEISKVLEDGSIKLAVAPTLEAHVAPVYDRRKQTVGYGELMRWTQLVKNLILEGRVRHRDEQLLNEHMARAVAKRNQQNYALSSKSSPGPIELARCAVFAAALASRPRVVGKAAIGSSRPIR